MLLRPGRSEVHPNDVDLKTEVCRGITLNIPLVSAAMDTVTEAPMAIAMALQGGIGIVHKNMAAEHQAREVRTVKKYESGVIREPITVAPGTSVHEVMQLTRAMAEAWSRDQSGITCNAIAPGLVPTDLTSSLPQNLVDLAI